MSYWLNRVEELGGFEVTKRILTGNAGNDHLQAWSKRNRNAEKKMREWVFDAMKYCWLNNVPFDKTVIQSLLDRADNDDDCRFVYRYDSQIRSLRESFQCRIKKGWKRLNTSPLADAPPTFTEALDQCLSQNAELYRRLADS